MTSRWTSTRNGMSVLAVAALMTVTLPRLAAADDYDPPGRVARLSHVTGSVSFQPAGESDWVRAVLNRPVTTGDRLWADSGSRAEMQLGSATIRLDAGTGVSFFSLDDRNTQLELSEGVINIRITRLDRDENFEIDTPNQAFSIVRPGEYRIEASEDGESTWVTVRGGEGEATGSGRTYHIAAGQTASFTGTDLLRASVYRADDNDEFDRWCDERDRRHDQSGSARYVSRDVVGYQDLDDYGSWRSDATYGNVWMPRVAAGWAPYHDGHWVWISPWGWTWVDDAPWGYAPFHYGRWVSVGNGWGWVPGPIAVRPVYAPALVAFVGGPRFSLSVSVGDRGGSGGDVGWFPLGPREVYVPSYRTSREYVDRVNITNTTVNNTVITNVYNNQTTNVTYVNRSVRGGVTAVSRKTFANSEPVARAVVAVNQQEVTAAPVSRRAEVAPTSNSVFGSAAPRDNRARPSARAFSRAVVAKTPPPPPPVPFEKQREKLAAQPGQPLARTEVEGLRPATPPAERVRVKQAPPGKAVAADSDQPRKRPGRVENSVPAPANVGRTPAEAAAPPAPPARNDRPNGRDRRERADAPPATAPPAADPVRPPADDAPPVRNNRPNRRQPDTAPPASPPVAEETANPPADRGRPNRPNAVPRERAAEKPADKPADSAEPAPPAGRKGKQPAAKEPPPDAPPSDRQDKQDKQDKRDKESQRKRDAKPTKN